MKTTILTLVTTLALAGSCFAQSGRSVSTTDAATEQSTCMVTVTGEEGGCDISFDVRTARERGSGLATGKRQHSPVRYKVSATDNSVSVKSPRDAASGQATGKSVAGSPIGGLSIKGGKNPGGNQFTRVVAQDGSFTLPDDCPEGDYTLVLSWSWGTAQAGSNKKGNASFALHKGSGGWNLKENVK